MYHSEYNFMVSISVGTCWTIESGQSDEGFENHTRPRRERRDHSIHWPMVSRKITHMFNCHANS